MLSSVWLQTPHGETKTSPMYSHLITKHSPSHNLSHGVEAMTGGHVDAEVPMVVPLDIFSWRTTRTVNCFNSVVGTNFFLVHPSSLNRQV